MQATPGFKIALIWLAGCVAALVVALAPVSSAVVNGHFIPVGPDAFYHGRRILDTVANFKHFFQFDPFIHAPEGSLVTWPWAYDWTLSLIVRAALALHLSRDPLVILDSLPVLGYVLAISVVMVLCRRLGLSLSATLLALLATAFFPLNQATFELGNFHHHFAEQLFVLASLVCGFGWLQQPQSTLRAMLAGALLGISVGVHTTQFILQVPLLLAFAWMWARRQSLPSTMLHFVLALAIATLCVALPSLSLREGHFEVYTLSWFQVYIAACTAILSVLFSRLEFSTRNATLICLIAVVMAAIAVGPLLFAGRFFTNAIAGMGEIAEVRSPWTTAVQPGGPGRLASYYSYLIFAAPLTFGFILWKLWSERDAARAFFWITSALGLLLLLQQIRLNYFGSYALYLPWIVLLDQDIRTGVSRSAGLIAGFGLALIAYWPGFHAIFERKALANDVYYEITRPLYPALTDACAKDPGIVLAEPFDGHYIRFHTACSVIADPFLVTPQDERKFLEERGLLQLPPAQIRLAAPAVRYVFVRRRNIFYTAADGSKLTMANGNPADPNPLLVDQLLATPEAQLPPGFHLLKELFFVRDGTQLPYARLFAIDHP